MRFSFLLLILPVLVSCSSGYHSRLSSAYNAYYAGKYEEALVKLEKVVPANRDKLLYLLDKGMFLHAAGKYAESNTILTEAEELSEAFASKSVSRETAATLGSEEANEYAGDKHERVMIPVIRMINYIMLDKWDDALIEVRRVLTITEKVYGNQKELKNAFAIYLSAITWEALGHINDALISYNSLQHHNKTVPYYGHDIKNISSKLRIGATAPSDGSLAWNSSKDYRKHPGQLLIIAEADKSPVFVSKYVTTGLITVAMPELKTFQQNLQSIRVSIDGEEAGSTYPFYKIIDDIKTALKERRKRSIARKAVKVPVQTGLYVASEELSKKDDTEKKLAGAGLGILGLLMSASEKADERSWRTLPGQFQLGRFYVPTGPHEVELTPIGSGGTLRRSFDIRKDKPTVWLIHYLPSSVTTEAVSCKEIPASDDKKINLTEKPK